MNHVSILPSGEVSKPQYLLGRSYKQTEDFSYITWAELCKAVAEPTETDKTKAQVLGPFDALLKTGDAVRAHDNFTLLIADIDDGNPSISSMRALLEPLDVLSFLIYSTASHQVNDHGNRWRVCIEISRGIPLSRWEVLQAYLCHKLGGDDCALRKQQIAFMPNRGAGGYEHHIARGAALDPLDDSHLFVAAALGFRQETEQSKRESSARPALREVSSQSGCGLSPIDEFNKAYTLPELLGSFGYRQLGDKWLHPDSTSGEPGVVLLDGRYFSHHSRETDPLADGHTHDAFGLLVSHQHGGDFTAALKASGDELMTTEGISINLHNQRAYMHEQEQVAMVEQSAEQAEGIQKLNQLDVVKMINTPPPPRIFLFRDPGRVGVIKEGIGAGLAAPGGTGKSTVLLDMAYATAIGGDWLGHYKATGPRKVFFFTAEDDAAEIHHRISLLHKQYSGEHHIRAERLGDIPVLLEDNLKIFCILGLPFSLTVTDGKSGYTHGPAAQQIVDIINKEGGSGLVMIDPLRKVTAGNEEGAAMTQIISTCDWIREQTTGITTTMLSHHSSQSAKQDSDDSSAAFRGATDLVDGLRWTMVMHTLSEKQAKYFGVSPRDRTNYRQYSFPKSNYSEQQYGLFLRYTNGTYRHAKLVNQKVSGKKEKAKNAMPILCKVLAKTEKLGDPVSQKTLLQYCKAKPNQEELGTYIPIGKNQEAVRTLLLEAKQEGLVEDYPIKFPINNQQGTAWGLTDKGKKLSLSGV